MNKLKDVLQAAERCLEIIQQQKLGNVNLARAYNNLGVIRRNAGEPARAKELYEEALKCVGDETEESRQARGLIRLNRGVMYASLGDWTTAEEDFRASLRIHQAAPASDHSIAGDLLNNIGVVLQNFGRGEESDTVLKQALEIYEQLGDTSKIALLQSNLASLYRDMEYFAEAEARLQRALRIWDANSPKHTLMDASETALLHTVTLREDPLGSDPPDDFERLPRYSKTVESLRASSNLKRTVEKLGPWYHNIEIQPGLFTNPSAGDHPMSRWRVLEPFVPSDVNGKSVLDIGCNAGFFSLEMKRRGAGRVVGIDIMPHVLAQARFMSAWTNLRIHLREMDTYDAGKLGRFDFIFFVGVLYHLKHPLYALEKIAEACEDTMFFQSVIRGPAGDFTPKADYPQTEISVFDLPEYPKMYFIEKSFNGDVSNWWFATRSCLIAMLRTAGFREIISTDSPDTFICRK